MYSVYIVCIYSVADKMSIDPVPAAFAISSSVTPLVRMCRTAMANSFIARWYCAPPNNLCCLLSTSLSTALDQLLCGMCSKCIVDVRGFMLEGLLLIYVT
jgi:hypothetical protein